MSVAAALRLPELLIIGAMKGGTSALHRYLDDHPDIAMAGQKEVNFFFGPDAADHRHAEDWHAGNWHRGLKWYASRFDPAAPVRGESSPGYTSPSHPEAAERIAAVAPHARLIYLVRDPLGRALSQFHHHVREGDEKRRPEEALTDAGSQYISRSRYFERLRPFLDHFPAQQLCVVAQEELLEDRRAVMAQVYEFAGVDPEHWSDALHVRWHTHDGERASVPDRVAAAFADAVREDADALRRWTGRAFESWSV